MTELAFELPTALEANAPPLARGLTRDAVRLMVSWYQAENRVIHTRFNSIVDYLGAGDVLVINTSKTLPAALNATRDDGTPFELHLSTHLKDDLWVVEVRKPERGTTKPYFVAHPDEHYTLAEGGEVRITAPYSRMDTAGGVRLWQARLTLPVPWLAYLERHGFPIRYSYVPDAWGIEYYQTVYANEPGSAEAPSAGLAFTPEIITQLVAKGVLVVPLVLHTGVASLETHEPPYAEYYRVPDVTARAVNLAHENGGRVIAVGTTVVRALESVVRADCGCVHAGEGWTELIITPERGVFAVDGLLTGLHEPQATHLAMLEAIAGLPHLKVTYREALTEGYLWHEFGDLHLILPK